MPMLVTIDEIEMGKRLAELRNEHGYDQKCVAKKLGVTPGTVCNWECGRRTPRVIHILMLAKLYGTDSNYILMGEKKRPARQPFGALIDGDELVHISFGPGEDVVYEHDTTKS